VVVRLKSGDPLIFGRAGEELDVLQRAGIEVEIVPGVTAALAAAASVQASLTDRRTADQLLVISAHREHGKDNSDWKSLVTSRTTIVVYMPGEYACVAGDLRRVERLYSVRGHIKSIKRRRTAVPDHSRSA
jgi:siroheme synthase